MRYQSQQMPRLSENSLRGDVSCPNICRSYRKRTLVTICSELVTIRAGTSFGCLSGRAGNGRIDQRMWEFLVQMPMNTAKSKEEGENLMHIGTNQPCFLLHMQASEKNKKYTFLS